MGGSDERRGKATLKRCWLCHGLTSEKVEEGIKATLRAPGVSPLVVLSEAEDLRGVGE